MERENEMLLNEFSAVDRSVAMRRDCINISGHSLRMIVIAGCGTFWATIAWLILS